MRGAKANVAVLGAGVIGLSTAVCIQESIPSAKVTIFADKFLEETLSNGAGGLFRPGLECGTDIDSIKKYYSNTYEYFLKLNASAENTGVQSVSGYHLSSIGDSECRNEFLMELLPDMRQTSISELNVLFPDKFKFGYFYTTIITDPRYYLPWLQNKFISSGGTVERKHIEDLSSSLFLHDFDAVVNC
ncbi:D-aspartate oxidase-like protein, partial [Leptotrombidium deliense]